MKARKPGPSSMRRLFSRLLSEGWPKTFFTESRPLTLGERVWVTKALKRSRRFKRARLGSSDVPADKDAAFAYLLKLCNGDIDAASWILRMRDRRGPSDRLSDPVYALNFWRKTVCGIFDGHRQEFETGRREALFETISMAALFDAPIPEWARAPFQSGWSRYQALVPDDMAKPNLVTLGGAFGITHPGGLNIPAARLKKYEHFVTTMVEVEAKDVEKTQAFEIVAHKLSEHILSSSASEHLLDARVRTGITASKVREIYYSHRASDPFGLYGGSQKENPKRRGPTTAREARSEEAAKMLRRWR